MNIDFTQSELNELVYAIGFAQMEGRMIRKDIADQVEGKLYRALVLENERLDKVLEHDALVHDMNFKTKYIQTGHF